MTYLLYCCQIVMHWHAVSVLFADTQQYYDNLVKHLSISPLLSGAALWIRSQRSLVSILFPCIVLMVMMLLKLGHGIRLCLMILFCWSLCNKCHCWWDIISLIKADPWFWTYYSFFFYFSFLQTYYYFLSHRQLNSCSRTFSPKLI